MSWGHGHCCIHGSGTQQEVHHGEAQQQQGQPPPLPSHVQVGGRRCPFAGTAPSAPHSPSTGFSESPLPSR